MTNWQRKVMFVLLSRVGGAHPVLLEDGSVAVYKVYFTDCPRPQPQQAKLWLEKVVATLSQAGVVVGGVETAGQSLACKAPAASFLCCTISEFPS